VSGDQRLQAEFATTSDYAVGVAARARLMQVAIATCSHLARMEIRLVEASPRSLAQRTSRPWNWKYGAFKLPVHTVW
jgi:hypothetical protein